MDSSLLKTSRTRGPVTEMTGSRMNAASGRCGEPGEVRLLGLPDGEVGRLALHAAWRGGLVLRLVPVVAGDHGVQGRQAAQFERVLDAGVEPDGPPMGLAGENDVRDRPGRGDVGGVGVGELKRRLGLALIAGGFGAHKRLTTETQRHRRQKKERSQNHSLQTVLEQLHIEVQQQSGVDLAELQVGQELGHGPRPGHRPP